MVALAESSIRSLSVYSAPEKQTWSSVREAMTRAADAVRRLSGQTELPIRLAEVGKLRGVRGARFCSLRYSEAKLVPVEGGFNVLLSNTSYRVRQRASFAHELAHTFFYDMRAKRPSRLIPNGTRNPKLRAKEEEICWAFASELLMPRELVSSIVENHQGGRLDLASEIAERCEVSLEFAIRKLLYSYGAFEDCIAVLATPTGKGSRHVRRLWGKTARQSHSLDVRDSSAVVLSALKNRASTDDVLAHLLESAHHTASAHQAEIEWQCWDWQHGESFVAVFSTARTTQRSTA